MDPSPFALSLFIIPLSSGARSCRETALSAGSLALPFSTLPIPLPPLRQDILPLTNTSITPSSFDTLQKLVMLERRKLHTTASVSLPAALHDLTALQMSKGELNNVSPTVPSFPPAQPSLCGLGDLNSLSTAAQLQALQRREAELMAQMLCVKQQKQALSTTVKPTVTTAEGSTSSISSPSELPPMRKYGERPGSQGPPSKRRKGERRATVVRQDQFHAAVAAQLLDDMAKGQAGQQTMKRKAPELLSLCKPREGKTCANPGRLDAAEPNAIKVPFPQSSTDRAQSSQPGASSSPAPVSVSTQQTMTTLASADELNSVGKDCFPEDSRRSFADAKADPLTMHFPSSVPWSQGGAAVESSATLTGMDGKEQALVQIDSKSLSVNLEWSKLTWDGRNLQALDLKLKL